MRNSLTEQAYWDNTYTRSAERRSIIDLDDFRQLPEKRIIDTIEAIGLDNKDVLEIGAGNSSKLLTLAKRNGKKTAFFGLDYSVVGCSALRANATAEGMDIQTIHADMFDAPSELNGRFDVIYSIGVVEHFERLDLALECKRQFLRSDGTIFTLIPNMSGILGRMTAQMAPAVYEIHNPHTLKSFIEGHEKARLAPTKYGYLCSTNFGVLSSCFKTKSGPYWKRYVALSRLSKALWFLESNILELPRTSWLSPYMYVVSKAV
jgi:2-polyprenyl-3-methyl-5-hydroxy-6-metoxy-1,4-benzoquinol methylase